jgi:hypothetical protein
MAIDHLCIVLLKEELPSVGRNCAATKYQGAFNGNQHTDAGIPPFTKVARGRAPAIAGNVQQIRVSSAVIRPA